MLMQNIITPIDYLHFISVCFLSRFLAVISVMEGILQGTQQTEVRRALQYLSSMIYRVNRIQSKQWTLQTK